MLLNLNNDCLEYICEFLDISQQITVKNVCQRLDEIIQSIWQRKAKTVVIKENEKDYFREEKKYFLPFMKAISNVVEELNLGRLGEEEFHLLQNLEFPRVTTFECSFWSASDDPNDDDVLQIAKMFPSLTKLSIDSGISGKHLAIMCNLNELDLGGCEFLDTVHFEKIFTTLKLRKLDLMYYGYNTLLDERISAITLCKTLEELSIDDHHLSLIVDDLLKMPNMMKITCYTRDYDEYLLEKISNNLGPRIHTMVYHDVFWSRSEHVQYLKEMSNLKKLIFYEDDMDEEQLNEIIEHLRKLREFRWIKGRVQNEEELLNVLKNNQQLEIFEVSDMKVSSTFLNNVLAIIEKQKRIIPLQFCCFGTGIPETLYENLQLPSSLCINTKEQKLQLPGCRTFELEWTASNAE